MITSFRRRGPGGSLRPEGKYGGPPVKFGDRDTETLSMKYASLMERVLRSGTNDDSWFCRYPKELLAPQRELAIETVRKCGVPIDTETEFEVQYDGKTIYAGATSGWGSTGLQHPSNIIHDLAHWAVCGSLKRRSMPDFGLGRGPDTSGAAEVKQTMDDRKTQKEEERASILGILMECELGLPAADTLRLHQWFFPFDPQHSRGRVYETPDGKEWYTETAQAITQAINWLVEKGLVDQDGNVVWTQVSAGVAR